MVISHRYQFIFIKTAKTAGTSIETYLSSFCDLEDVFTPFSEPESGHVPRNFTGFFNPFSEILTKTVKAKQFSGSGVRTSVRDFLRRRRFFHHIPAWQIRSRISKRVWSKYYKFCVERNPWEKVISAWYWYQVKYKQEISMDSFLDKITSRIQMGHPGVGVCPYNFPNYSEPRTGAVLVDEIIRYENLNTELERVFAQLGLPFSASLNIYNKAGLRRDREKTVPVLNAEQVERIRELFDKELALFPYQPPEV